MTQPLSLQLSHRAQFERNVTKALLFGVGAGLLGLSFTGSHDSSWFTWGVAASTPFAFTGGDRFERWVVRVLAVGACAVALIFPDPFGRALCGAISGLLISAATVSARGSEATVAQLRPGPASYVAAAGAGAIALPVGMAVAYALSHRAVDLGAPWMFAMPLGGAVSALFLAMAALPAHLLLQDDPVERRGLELALSLKGQLGEVVAQLLGAYRHCGELLAELPREPARAELAKSLGKSTSDALDLAEEWARVEAQLDQGAEADLGLQLHELKASAARAKDLLARKQLELAAESLEEQLQELAALESRRERTFARLKALTAQLSRTRVALVGLKAARTQAKSADLLALSRKVQALSALEATRADLQQAEAEGEELGYVEALEAAQQASAARARAS